MADKAIFLDRDDTLIHDPGYISHPDQVKLIEGAAECLISLRELGFKLVVVTNQSAVARGIVTEKVLHEIHQKLHDLLAGRGAKLDRIYYCPHHPEGVIEKYRKSHPWRKPSPGMLLAAAKDLDLDLGQSWCIGDGLTDVEAGIRAGCRTILIDPGPGLRPTGTDSVRPDYTAVNLREAVNIIKQSLRSPQPNKPVESAAAQCPEAPMPQDPVPCAPVTPPPASASATQAPAEPVASHAQGTQGTDALLKEILDQMRTLQRQNLFKDDFSSLRLVAGMAQVGVLGCLLIATWLLLSPTRDYNGVFTALGFGAVLQVMAMTLYGLHDRL